MISLAQEIQNLVRDLPEELVEKLASALEGVDTGNWQRLRIQLTSGVVHPTTRSRLEAFIGFWQTQTPGVQPDSVALALRSAAAAIHHERRLQRLELVWTGPDSHVIPLRRTDQALLQLIREAQQSLHIVSFAVYKIESIAQALALAAGRGVALFIYLETPDASEGKITWNTLAALGEAVRSQARIYVWPKEKRPKTADGKHGSLHAKIALADGHTLLISSANLTEYAMTLNMEMGVLLRGGPYPGQLQQHLAKLVESGVFQLV